MFFFSFRVERCVGSTRGSRETERAAVTRNSRIVGPLVCLAILGERKYPVLKSSFAYCASRRRVFGSANNGGLPLSTSLFLLSLSLPPRPLPLLGFRGAHVCSITRMPPGALFPSDDFSKRARARETGGIRRFPEREPVDHPRSRTSGLAAHSPDHPGRSLGHSRDFHSSRHRGQTPRASPSSP